MKNLSWLKATMRTHCLRPCAKPFHFLVVIALVSILLVLFSQGSLAAPPQNPRPSAQSSQTAQTENPGLNPPSRVQQAAQNESQGKGEAVEGVRLVVNLESTAKKMFEPLEPVTLLLVLKNTSKLPMEFTETTSSQDYDITVKDSMGNVMPATRYGTKPDAPVSSATGRTSLQPNEEAKFKVTLNRMVDMTVDGVYSATIRRSVSQAGKFGYVESNALRVVVATLNTDDGVKTLSGGEVVESP